MTQRLCRMLHGLLLPLGLAFGGRSLTFHQGATSWPRERTLQRTILIVWLAVFATVPTVWMDEAIPAADPNLPPGFPLKFTVSSAATSYDRSEPIRLTLSLRLDSSVQTDVTVTTFEAGTISVVSATRDEKPVEPLKGTVRFEDDPVLLQIDALRTLTPGDRMTIPFDVPHIPSEGSKLIVEQLEPEDKHVALIYPLMEPGLYRLQFLYHYTGPDDGKPNIFRGEVPSNTITFRLR
jgi:hypothetical protein